MEKIKLPQRAKPVTPTAILPTAQGKVAFGTPPKKSGQRIVLYGTGGIGKTTLAANLTGSTAFIDVDESLSALGMEEQAVVTGVHDFQSLRDALNSEGWDGVDNIVIDTATKVEEWCIQYTIKNVKHEKGAPIKSIEDYGWGKGYQHNFETFMLLLSDLDAHVRAGRNVVLICHDCSSNVPNPFGDDYIRFEPRLQSPSSGKSSIRLRVKEWADHLLFLAYDIHAKDGKGLGTGTRTLYRAELPSFIAKSRTGTEPIPVVDINDVWPQILNK